MRDLFKEWLDDKHHSAPYNEPEFMPTTMPFHKNGKVCKLWHDAAVKAGVLNKQDWEGFREKFLKIAEDHGVELKISDEVLPLQWV